MRSPEKNHHEEIVMIVILLKNPILNFGGR